MKTVYLFIIFITFIGLSCSNLDLNKIECDSNSSCPSDAYCNTDNKCILCPSESTRTLMGCDCKENYSYNEENNRCIKTQNCNRHSDCNDSSICYGETCRECPKNSQKATDTCICNADDDYFYKEKNECVSKVCYSEIASSHSRTPSCQDGLGYCIKENGEATGICKTNSCTTHKDCSKEEQCTLTFNDNLLLLICKKTGNIEEGGNCGLENCEKGLSCLKKKDENGENLVCQQMCIPNNDHEILSCSENTICLDAAFFEETLTPNTIGGCVPEDIVCTFETGYPSEVNNSCNSNKGVCLRKEEMLIGFCNIDTCNPIENNCESTQKCMFNGMIFECREKNTTGKTLSQSCSNTEECRTDLICSEKKCIEPCRPNNIYNYNTCSSLKTCKDIKELYPDININNNVTGKCLLK